MIVPLESVLTTTAAPAIDSTLTTVNGTADLVEKNASDKIYVTGNAVEVSKVGFTN